MVRSLKHIKTAIKGPRFVGVRMNQAPFVLPVKKDIPEILNRRNVFFAVRDDKLLDELYTDYGKPLQGFL